MAENTMIDRSLVAGFQPYRTETGHKNTFGTALICAGSAYMTGAAVMAAGSALRSGAGLVRVFSEEKTLDAVRSLEPCALLSNRPEITEDLLGEAFSLCRNADAVLIGSGIPRDYEHMEVLTATFLREAKAVVLDAGALSDDPGYVARLGELLAKRPVPAVITPHIGEFAGMLGMANSEVVADAEELARKFSEKNKCVMVLKNHKTIVAVPEGKIFLYEGANSGLAKGGSGDVLAGLITGLLAQGMEPYKAACSAVYIHSKAGEAAAEDIGKRAMLPSDIVMYFPEGYREAGWSDDNG